MTEVTIFNKIVNSVYSKRGRAYLKRNGVRHIGYIYKNCDICKARAKTSILYRDKLCEKCGRIRSFVTKYIRNVEIPRYEKWL